MANTETTITSDQAWRPDLSAFAPTDVVADALILQHSTVAGSIEGDAPSVRVAFVDDDAAEIVVEGTAISEANPDLSEALIYTSKVAQLIRLSREQWMQSGTSAQLAASVQRAIVRKANTMFVAQPAPIGPLVAPPAGVLNIAGIGGGVAVEDSLDNLVDTIATIEGNDGDPSGILLSPAAWANLRKFKTATGSKMGILGAGTDDAELRLLGIPVTVTSALSGVNGLVIDKRAIVSAVGPVNVASNDSVYFASDSVALRATWRLGWAPVHANRLAAFVVPGPGSVAAKWDLTLSGTPTGGTYTLSVNGLVTTALAYNADATAVGNAINALTGVSGATVTGTTTKLITLGVPALLTADGSTLTGGTAPAANVVHN